MLDASDFNRFHWNVREIPNNWNWYPLPPATPASCAAPPRNANAGVLEVKCFINNICPFTKVDPQDIPLVFNASTLANLLPDFPPIFRNVLTTTPGTEGMHFSPRYVFRHNYMYQTRAEFAGQAADFENDISDDNFDRRYKEITEGEGEIAGVDSTRYKKHQSWISVPSFFDTTIINDEGEVECTRSKWSYSVKNESDNNAKMIDMEHDYNKETYDKFKETIEEVDGGWALKENTKPYIVPNTIQFPTQQRTREELGQGVHWRIRKRTRLYRGEDFFIRFYKTAKEPTTKSVHVNIPKFQIKNNDAYKTLDVTNIETISLPGDLGSLLDVPINLAVKPPTASKGDIPDTKYYDFSSQAYYIIELGYKSKRFNFFIIITERTFPICVNVQNGISRMMGDPFTGISGAALIDANFFNITVRNHLQNIIVQFEGPNMTVPPWIISRDELELDMEDGAELPTVVSKPSIMQVPEGYMLIHGGNLKSGFIFGPLQYSAGEAGFLYPPRGGYASGEELDIFITTSGRVLAIGEEKVKAIAIKNPFFLPIGGDHKITFSLPEVDRYEFDKQVSSGDKDFIIVPFGEKKEMFTQDAQYYSDYIDKHRSSSSSVKSELKYGSYFYRETLKEIGYTVEGSRKGKQSVLSVGKYRYINDAESNYQAFDLIIHMLVGDHVFVDDDSYRVPIPDTGAGRPVTVRWGPLVDWEWCVADCKTPIMTSIRLMSGEGKEIRWNDGTTIENGMSFNPFYNPANPYFIDATDHVLSYSDSWSATDYTQVDHTGSINFLLGDDFNFGHNVTDKLYALQNKTFYIEMWVGYRDCNYTRIPGLYKMFTGLCYGGQISYEYGKNIMTCKIVDFTKILEDMLFFNSPFFDGLRDINAIDEILSLAGFRHKGLFDPAHLVRELTKHSNSNSSTMFFKHIDGRNFKMEPYALPSGYDRLNQPMFKFDDGSSFLDGISAISKKSAKVFFFDQFGIAHYEELGDIIEKDFQGKVPLFPLFNFTTNPDIFSGQLVFDKVEHSYAVSDIFNHIKMFSNTPDMHLLLLDRINFKSLDNPDYESFIGYKKTFYQQEALFGSKAALKHATNKYSVMFKPYIEYKFETYGVPLRANDMIKINGETVRVMNVNHELDATTNRWWMTVEAKRYQPIGVPVNRPRKKSTDD